MSQFTYDFVLKELYQPLTNDWTVTGKGAVIIRMTWKSLEWDEAAENELIAMCNRVVKVVKACSDRLI